MISSYLYTIGKYLPKEGKEDLLKEIEANLYDYLEGQFGSKDYTDTEIEAAIRALGHPRKVAQNYTGRSRSLIGPELWDTYWLVVKIALIGSSVGITIAYLIGLPLEDTSSLIFGQLLAQIWNACLSAFGMVTLIFAIIELKTPQDHREDTEKWSLSILEKPALETTKVKYFDLAVESFFTLLFLSVLNKLPDLINGKNLIHLGLDPGKVYFPDLRAVVYADLLVWINIVLGLGLVLNLYLLIVGRFNLGSRLASIALDIGGLVLFAQVLLSRNLWSFENLKGEHLTQLDSLNTVFAMSGNIALAVVTVIVGFEIFSQVRAILKERP